MAAHKVPSHTAKVSSSGRVAGRPGMRVTGVCKCASCFKALKVGQQVVPVRNCHLTGYVHIGCYTVTPPETFTIVRKSVGEVCMEQDHTCLYCGEKATHRDNFGHWCCALCEEENR